MPGEVLDELRDAVLQVGAEVLRLEWDCESPAGSGYARLVRCADCFVLGASDDWPDLGPFSSLDEALRCGAFAQCFADKCRITSTLDAKITMALATQLTRNRRQAISINGRRWHWAGDSLRAFDADLPDAQAPRANATQSLTEFAVDSQGVLTPLGFEAPTTRAAAFESDVYDWSGSPKALAEVAERFPPLEWLLNDLYQEARDQLLESIAAETKRPASPQTSRTLRELEKQLAAMPEEPCEGLPDWLQRQDSTQFQTVLVPKIHAWLAQPPEAEESEFGDGASGQEMALRYFRDRFDRELAPASPEDIGVEVVEGPHPGSDFCAAFLRIPIEKANAAASALGIPIRFRPETSQPQHETPSTPSATSPADSETRAGLAPDPALDWLRKTLGREPTLDEYLALEHNGASLDELDAEARASVERLRLKDE